MKKIFILAIILFPFQNMAIPLATSRYDLTCFILLLVTIYYTFKNWKINSSTFYFLYLFIFIQFSIFLVLSVTPFYRFISALVWLGGLILIIFTSPKISFNTLIVSKLFFLLCSFISIVVVIQYYFLQIERPLAFFDEPSTAGLILYSTASAIVAILLFVKTALNLKLKAVFFLIIITYAALLTKSMHIVTLIISVSLVLFIKLLIIQKRSVFKSIFFITFVVLVLIFFGLTIFQDSHYYSRIDTSNASSNLSLLSWLRGYDQMIASTIQSPIFGHGVGSTGEFEFISIYSNELKTLGFTDLNLKDGFSLAFRLIIEIGPLLFIVFMIYLIKKLLLFKNVMKNIKEISNNDSIPVIFLFIFSTSLIIGSLLKEPTYAKSPLYIGIFLFSSPLLKNISK